MKKYHLKRQQQLPISLNEAWAFFATPKNLAKITPANMRFEIKTELTDNTIYPGLNIAYRVRPLFNIPVNWLTEISEVDQQHSFTDIQLKGPFAYWAHKHQFEAKDGGVLMTDTLTYVLPFAWLGRLAHSLFVKKRIEQIFNHRGALLETLFIQKKDVARVA